VKLRISALVSERSSWFEVRLDFGVGQILRDCHLDVIGQSMASLDRPVGRNEDGKRNETVPA